MLLFGAPLLLSLQQQRCERHHWYTALHPRMQLHAAHHHRYISPLLCPTAHTMQQQQRHYWRPSLLHPSHPHHSHAIWQQQQLAQPRLQLCCGCQTPARHQLPRDASSVLLIEHSERLIPHGGFQKSLAR